MIRKLYACLVILLFTVSSTFGQAQRGEIRGVIKDAKTKQPLDFVQVAAFLGGYNAGGTLSDLDGKYS
ncbi:MAG: carboxypeptidase-like regulatory domain-containing protein, partial [Bacteroidota bacterium]|nr:carboxypeptidase-like regulatory domain-containing protein [Bacteroidota bacterium]MDX5430365.1 carboxypeptidase-like regulatory domain-containing protein [Bacteroidota bacterium]MDX5469126.1 carboxypeptidase-like regulatory domain-containing protein [Bacteroidota bacterium]